MSASGSHFAAIRPLAVLAGVIVVCCGMGVVWAADPSPASAPSEQWWPVPLVPKAVRDAGHRPGGEGGQWPQAICIDPVDGKFLLYGTDVGGIFRSLDGGKTFEPCNMGYTPRGNCGFAIDPVNTNRALAIGANSLEMDCHGIYLTTDKGSSWTHVLPRKIKGYRDFREQVTFDKSSYDAGVGYCKVAYWSAAASSVDASGRLYRSADGGKTWAEVADSQSLGGGIFKVHPTKGYVYVANSGGLLKSIDAGRSFAQKVQGGVTGLDVVATQPDMVFACKRNKILVSRDTGDTFTGFRPVACAPALRPRTGRGPISPCVALTSCYGMLGKAGTWFMVHVHLPRPPPGALRKERFMSCPLRAVLAAAIACLLAQVAPADQAEEAFQARFGAQYDRVKATRDTIDDVSLAIDLLRAAEVSTADPALLALLCEKAYELGLTHVTGYGVAVDAMELTASHLPDRRPACLANIVGVREREFKAARGPARETAADNLIDALIAAADVTADLAATAQAIALLRQADAPLRVVPDRRADVQRLTDRQAGRLKTLNLAATLKKRLGANPADAALRKQLLLTLLVGLDDPAQAAAVLDASCDADMRKYVPAVAKGVDSAPELACVELAQWYRGLADTPTPAGAAAKAAVLTRAKAYCARYLTLHGAEDAERRRALAFLDRVEKALDALRPKATPGPWIDLLKLVQPARDKVQGQWELRGGALTGAAEEWASLFIRCAPRGDYEIEVAFMRTGGNSDVAVGVPLGAGQVGVLLSRRVGAFSHLVGVHAGTPAKTGPGSHREPGKLSNNRLYVLAIKVTQDAQEAEISVSLDRAPYLHWKGPPANVSDAGELKLPDRKGLGLGAWGSTVTFKRVRLRSLGGRIRSL